jgi:hypothetical protein
VDARVAPGDGPGLRRVVPPGGEEKLHIRKLRMGGDVLERL